jgi:flagellar secretion chaperone FliS
MDQRLRDYYIESQVSNATPGQMLVMLYDCLLEQAEVAEREMATLDGAGDFRIASHAVTRCIKMLTELNGCLRRNVEPALCTTLSDLYRFFMGQLYESLQKREAKNIRAIIPLIRRLRETWVEADRRANKYQPGSVAAAA